MYCENCGARIDDDSKFCENCGVLIKESADAEPPAEPGKQEAEEMKTESGVSDAEAAQQPVTDLDELIEMERSDEIKTGAEGIGDTQIFTKENFLKSESAVNGEAVEAREELKADAGEEMRDTAAEPPEGAVFQSDRDSDFQEKTSEISEIEVPDFLAGNIIKGIDEDLEPVFEKEPGDGGPQDTEPEPAVFVEIPDLEEPEKNIEESAPEDLREPDEELKSEPPEGGSEAAPLFCMACGRRLPKGAAFCDACGTPTGEVAPVEIHRKRQGQGVFTELAKAFFIKPAATIKRAAAEDAFLPGIVFLLIKDGILAVLAAVFMGRLTVALGPLGTWLVGGDAFGFGAKAFLIGIVMDALWLGLLYGASVLFQGGGSIRELTGAWGTAGLLAAALLIVTTALAAFVPAAALCAGLITVAAVVMTSVKAVSAAMKVEEDRLLYVVLAAFACYCILLFVVARLFI